jgi:hypothetical protein
LAIASSYDAAARMNVLTNVIVDLFIYLPDPFKIISWRGTPSAATDNLIVGMGGAKHPNG